MLNLDTQERIRVDIQSSETVFGLALTPGDYEVIRVQINEGLMMMEFHVSWRFQILPNKKTYLGTWTFDVDTPRTRRMLRMEFSHGLLTWNEIFPPASIQRDQFMVVALSRSVSKELGFCQIFKIAYYFGSGSIRSGRVIGIFLDETTSEA